MIGFSSSTSSSAQANGAQANENQGNWDGVPTHRELLRLTINRGRFRFGRLISRLMSPRRIIASGLAFLLVAAYLLGGILILSTRAPASTGRLQLWLSGGMVLYAIYHALKCAWSSEKNPLGLSAAENLWLGGSPIGRSSIVVYQVTDLVLATLMKTGLLSIVLAVDVRYPVLLGIGIFSALLLLEISRLIVVRFVSSLDDRGRRTFRVIATGFALAVMGQVGMRVIAAVPSGAPTPIYVIQTFSALGETAASDMVQWLALPWTAAANVAVASSLSATTFLFFVIAILMLPISIEVYVRTDRWCLKCEHQQEQRRLKDLRMQQTQEILGASIHRPSIISRNQSSPWYHAATWPRLLAWIDPDAQGIASRTATSVIRYRGTIFFSLLVPTLLCLSPLVTGRVLHQWLFVVGGIAMCTSLIAPSALRLDFRRDLSRLLLLRAFPIRARSMVLGQLLFPVLITCLFQWTVIAVAAGVLRPGWMQVCLWTGMLAALAVFTFAVENALFLAYPHHERTEGIGMMIRTKLTFLGKSSLLIAAVALLAIWAAVCRHHLGPHTADLAIVAGAQLVTWSMAALAMAATTWCWSRFDISRDMAPR